MKRIALSVKATTPPVNLPHLSRAQEIADLPNWLTVDLLAAGSLSLMHVGETQPPPEVYGVPWLKTKSDGTPDDLMVATPSGYQPAIAGAVRSTPALPTNLRILHGECTLDLVENPGVLNKRFKYTYKDEGPDLVLYTGLAFNTYFKDAPIVLLTAMESDIHTITVDANWRPVISYGVSSVERDGFRMFVNLEVLGTTPPTVNSSMKFRWMAIGSWTDGEE